MPRIIFDPQKCEPYLSAFGKEVLQVISQRRNDNNERDNRINCDESMFHRNNNSRVLTFVDESLNTSNINAHRSPPIQIFNREQVLNCVVNMLPQTATAIEQIETFNDLHEAQNDNNFPYPINISSNINDTKLNSDKNNKRLVPVLKNVNARNDKFVKNVTIANVNWDNMFDPELYNFDDNESDDRIAKDNRNTVPSNIIPYKENSNSFCENIYQNINHGEKRKKVIDKLKISKKPKNHNITPEDVSNTIKYNDNVPKQSFRKQKYTTAVKNWLNDIDLYNTPSDRPKPEESDDTNNIIIPVVEEKQEINTGKGIKIKAKLTIDKTIKCTKKVVQARLANKNGIMKFTKPVQDKEPQTIEGREHQLFKDKKKLIPRIQCVTPAKDVTYEIFTVDETNANECCNDLASNVIKNLIVILIYSNGLCQLSSHSTEETCVTEGVLLGGGDKYYYVRGTGPNIRNLLVSVLEKNKIISYEARHVLMYLASHLQIDVRKSNIFDAKVGASLLDPDNPPENFSDLQKQLSLTAPYTIATECRLQKAAWYMTLLDECWMKLKEQLDQSQLWRVFVDIEMKLLPIISEMERRGVAVDVFKLKSMEAALLTRMKQVEQECYKAAGKVFQINSTVQVRSILYDELQLDTKHNIKVTETLSTGVKSTSETMLRSLATVHPLPKLILEYRHLHKAHATFLVGIAQHVKDGIVKPTWVQTAAATGRIASNNPNLQAIPKVPFSLVMFPDPDHKDELGELKFRSLYVSGAGRWLLAADFQQVECRVLAHLASDGALRAALGAPCDLFRELAARWLKIPAESVSGAERARCKRLVYASVYGAGARTLAHALGAGPQRALHVARSFHRTFPSLKSFGRHVVSRCIARGGRLATLSGRIRHFANITSEEFALRAHAQRQAVNFVVQGSAADLCKTAMILTEEHLRNYRPPLEAHLLLQIHDELVWEVNEQHLHTAAGIIKRVMEECGHKYGMSISLPVAITVGKNWAEMEPYPLVNSQQ